MWDDRSVTDRRPERIVPDGCPEVILHLGDPFDRREDSGRWRTQPRAFLAGTLSRPWTLRAGRRPRTLGIRLRPGVAARILDVPMGEMADREAPLDQMVGASADELLEAACEAPTIEGSLAAAGAWMAQRARAPRLSEPAARPAVDVILASRGRIRMEEAARSLGWSRRRLERAFAFDLGVSPKLFASIVRLNAVLASLQDRHRGSAADLALGAGYFDQSHLLRDFKALAGASPRGLEERAGELFRYLTRPERLRAALFGD